MSINSDHITGFVFGLGAAAVGFYLYRKNQTRVEQWLRKQGINVPQSPGVDPASVSADDLTARKEQLEKLIAEREAAAAVGDGAPATPK